MSAVVTAAHNASAPFDGLWETQFNGYTSAAAPTPNVGSVTAGLPDGVISVGGLPSLFLGPIDNQPAVMLVLENGTPIGGTLVLTNYLGVQADYAIAAAYFYVANENGSPWTGGTKYDTYAWQSSISGADFASTHTTTVDFENNMNLTGQAAGNAGTDVLLTWDPATCADTTFTIYQDGEAIDPVLGQPNTGFVVSQLSPDTTYEFFIVGDVNGGSNTVSVTTGCADAEVFNCDCSIEPVYQTLAQMRYRMMVRLGYPNQANNPPPGMSALVDAFLSDAQKLIWKQLSRAGLNVERFFRWVMVPGQRYYGISANADECSLKLDPYKVTWVGFEDLNRAWYRLTEGVPPEYYTRANINFGWPTHYEIRSCIELFPAPQAPYTLWIKGDFGLAPLVADGDTATIDDTAVFMLALGNAKAHYGQKDASSVLAQADTYIRGLVAGLHGTRRYVPRTQIQNPATPPRFLPLGDAQA